MPQFDPSTYSTQLFWLLLTFVPLYLVVWRVALPRITEVRQSRQGRIDSDLEKAQTLKEEAEMVLAAYERVLAEATSSAEAAHREVADATAEERAKRQAELAERLGEQIRAAEQRIADEKQKAAMNVRDAVVEVVGAAAKRLIGVEPTAQETSAAITATLKEAR